MAAKRIDALHVEASGCTIRQLRCHGGEAQVGLGRGAPTLYRRGKY
jgi:hypothetical protein